LNYFLVYTENGNLYTLSMSFEGAFRNIKWNINKVKEKWEFKNIFSFNFLSQAVENAFILNPFNYTIFEKNRANNTIFLLNNNICKIINLSIGDGIDIDVK
jgi:hypothetical protein